MGGDPVLLRMANGRDDGVTKLPAAPGSDAVDSAAAEVGKEAPGPHVARDAVGLDRGARRQGGPGHTW